MTGSNNFEKSIIVLLAVAVLAFSAVQFMQKSNIQVFTSGEQQQNTIQVNGEAQITTDPDKAEIYLGAQTDAVTAKDAQANNAAILAQIRDKLYSAGVSSSDIETSQFSVSPRYDYSEGKSNLVGYTAVQILKVSTKNLDKVGSYLDAASQAGANRIDSVTFTLTNEKELQIRNQALKQAAQNAIDKANSLASGFGVSKGNLVKISESTVTIIPYQKYFAAAGASASVPTEISPQQVNVQASVSAVFQFQ